VRACSVGAVHFVIMGCGRVGSTLALSLESQGHDVAVIDQNASAFRRLGTTFEGKRVTGIGFDRDTLTEAGIESTYAFAAVSNGDNSNILAARVARETFGVEHVVARIYDPGRAEVYQRLGIPTVATVRWTADQMLRRLLPQGSVPEHTDPSGRVVVAEVPVHTSWIGRPLTQIEDVAGARVAYLTRLGEGVVPEKDMVYQDGDLVHLVTAAASLATVEHKLDQPPPAE
jgi:trk system potassium uptake protein